MPILTFKSESDYQQSRGDLNFWWPHILDVLQRHDLPGADKRSTAIAGFNPTYPVFLIDDLVIKFFGHRPYWREALNTEGTAYEYLVNDPTLLAPHLIAKGQLFPESNEAWPYLVSSKISGQSWLDTPLTYQEKEHIAAAIGEQLRKIHQLPMHHQLQHDKQWSTLNLKAAVEKSVLPKHLIAQLDTFIAKLDAFDRCFVNGDIVDTHVFIDNKCLSGIIDWGDATVTDRHYELGKLMDTFDWDKELLKIVLRAANWPIKRNFSKQSLGLALYRQAVGLTQHSSFDVFYKLPDLLPLEEISTLDELADVLFDIGESS
jgi:hygromycin-B 7''-O-kinase